MSGAWFNKRIIVILLQVLQFVALPFINWPFLCQSRNFTIEFFVAVFSVKIVCLRHFPMTAYNVAICSRSWKQFYLKNNLPLTWRQLFVEKFTVNLAKKREKNNKRLLVVVKWLFCCQHRKSVWSGFHQILHWNWQKTLRIWDKKKKRLQYFVLIWKQSLSKQVIYL